MVGSPAGGCLDLSRWSRLQGRWGQVTRGGGGMEEVWRRGAEHRRKTDVKQKCTSKGGDDRVVDGSRWMMMRDHDGAATMLTTAQGAGSSEVEKYTNVTTKQTSGMKHSDAPRRQEETLRAGRGLGELKSSSTKRQARTLVQHKSLIRVERGHGPPEGGPRV